MSFKFEVIEPKLYDGAAADEVVASILDVLSEKKRCSLALAGGSTPVSIYRALSVPPRVESVQWDKVDMLFGDERWVPQADPQSNYKMVVDNFVAKLNSEKPNVLGVNTAATTPEEGAKQYEDSILSLESASKLGSIPQIDIVLLGMGDDGHTASIFPGSKLLTQSLDQQSLVSVEDWPGQEGAYRISMTPRLLLSAKKLIFLVKGANKAEMLSMAFNDKDLSGLPVHLFRAVSDKVTWLLDSEAARLLK